jgi:hypothetical protein
MDVVTRCGERYYEAEIRRLTGDLLLQQAADETGPARQAALGEAQAWFTSAQALAHEKSMASLSLRVAISQARLDADHGRAGQARAQLLAAIEAVSGGRETSDLLAAHALLENAELTDVAA